MSDVLEQLLEFRWRDIGVPVSDFSTDLQHDQVEHKWPDRDGAHVEATGRAPLVHHATIHFRNNLSPGINETWRLARIGADGTFNADAQALYPTVFRAFLVAFATRSTGPLQHPELGVLQCKPKQAQFKWTSTRRDGIDCTASWVESDDTAADFEDILARPSPVSDALVAGIDLDSQLVQYASPAVTFDGGSTSFLDDIQAVTRTFDTASLISAQYAGKIDRVLYRVTSLQSRLSKAADLSAWPLVTSCERLKSALYGLKGSILNLDRAIAHYTTKKDTTLAALTGATQCDIGNLLKLNPSLAARPAVPQGTVVRYYTK